MLGLGFAGFLLQFALLFLFVVAAFVVFAAIISLAAITHAVDSQRLAAWLPRFYTQGWIYSAVAWCVMALSQFHVGRWLARRSRDHELAPCVAFSLVGLTFSLALSLSFLSQPGVLHAIRDAVSPVLLVLLDAPLYAGAVSVRRKRATSALKATYLYDGPSSRIV
jgi:hypothetical protein